MSIGEQMFPFAGRTQIKQFVRGKRNPLGIKIYILTACDGLLLDFEVYQGNTTPLPNSDLPHGGKIVARLADTAPKKSALYMYFDRFFTNVKLMKCLQEKQIFGAGTVMSKRVAGNSLPTKKEMANQSRGFMTMRVKENESSKMCVVSWKGSKGCSFGQYDGTCRTCFLSFPMECSGEAEKGSALPSCQSL